MFTAATSTVPDEMSWNSALFENVVSAGGRHYETPNKTYKGAPEQASLAGTTRNRNVSTRNFKNGGFQNALAT